MDGNAGVARCVVHKLRNLEAHAPKRLIADLRSDFHAITEAETLAAARRAYDRFRRVWRPRAESVVRSLEEAGLELLTFYAFPTSQRRSRTSNPFCACFLDSMRVDRLSCGRLTAGSISRKCSRDARRQHDRVGGYGLSTGIGTPPGGQGVLEGGPEPGSVLEFNAASRAPFMIRRTPFTSTGTLKLINSPSGCSRAANRKASTRYAASNISSL